MNKILTVCFVCLLSFTSYSQVTLDYYLPQDIGYDPAIPKPIDVIGHEIGEWHITHDKLVQYMYAVARASDRIQIAEYARTYENRPLLLLTISSKENIQNIEAIKEEHLKVSNPNLSAGIDLDNQKAVVYAGYSVHGNEPSGSNASLVAVYYLAAGQSRDIDELLSNTVILLDPSYNPDGLNRFASWVNSHKSMNLVTDRNNREQNEAWPRGRTNHYWFDLNRDWLPIQHPESQGRIANFHKWKPNILTDHHEMGTNSSYFFQPGIPSRNNPNTPQNTYVLTEKIARYHAKGLDKIGSMYYSKESYDDFYYGKGSSYPDVNGAVGILFEQASSRSHAQESINGVLTFPFTIRNHFTTTLSTLQAAKELRVDLVSHQKEFYQSAIDKASSDPIKAYVFGNELDNTRVKAFTQVLKRHQIDVYKLTKGVKASGINFSKENALIVPLQQNQYRLIKAIFEKRTKFQDSLFYDVSAWTMPLAFDINYAELAKGYNASLLGGKVNLDKYFKTDTKVNLSNYAYAFELHDYNAHKVLYQLQKRGLITKVALEEFSTASKTFSMGSIIVPVEMQKMSKESIYKLMQKLGENENIQIHGLKTGYTSGYNLGSPNMKNLSKLKPMILVGDGISSYDAGEVWHLMDQRVGVALPMLTIDRFNSADLDRYNTLIMVNGSYGKLNKEKFRNWVKNGGHVIAVKTAAKWLSDNEISKTKFKKNKPDSTKKDLPYNMASRYRGAQVVGGAIFGAKMDQTHPICFGFADNQISVFRNSTLFMEMSENPYANPVKYNRRPLQSGYISKENAAKLEGTAAVAVTSYGQGKIVSFADNPNFRAFWYGTNKLFLNSLFFASTISSSTTR